MPQSFPPFPDNVPTAPISSVSFQKLREGDVKEEDKVFESCRTSGFFFLDLRGDNLGDQILKETDQLFELAEKTFDLPLEEKKSHHLENGKSLIGYKATGNVKKTDKDARPDTTEFYNVSKDQVHGFAPSRSNPSVVDEAKPLTKSFTKNAHECGMLILTALAHKLHVKPEDLHAVNDFNSQSESHVRMTKKQPHEETSKEIGLAAHCDFGTVTILFNGLGGLQIQSLDPAKEKQWEYVKPIPGHAIINLGDAMVKFSDGLLKSAKHRVVNAPGEQAKVDRYSLVYFVRPNNDTPMRALPGLELNGHAQVQKIWEGDDENKVFTAKEWIRQRAVQLGN